MTFRKILLLGIILATFVNLLTNLIWNYLPDSKVYPGTYTVATITIIIVCVLILIFGSESSTFGSESSTKGLFGESLEARLSDETSAQYNTSKENYIHIEYRR